MKNTWLIKDHRGLKYKIERWYAININASQSIIGKINQVSDAITFAKLGNVV